MAKASRTPGEPPGWVKVSIFAAALLALTWVGMWIDAPHVP
jgi:hypothetical protein